MFRQIVLAAVAVSTSHPALAASSPLAFRGEYSVSFLGLTVARSSVTSSFDGTAFTVDGTLSSAGLAEIFDNTKGSVSASGRLVKGEIRPESYRLDYTTGKKAKMTSIRFAGGKVSATENIPPLKKRDNWMPLGAGDLSAVSDPITATMVRADSLADVCNRTVRLYDGELRADVSLAYVSTAPVSVPGYSGEAVTCRASFNPVSGYRKGKRALEFLKKRSKMTVTFAPVGTTGVYAPVRATIGTEIGTINIKARRFEAID